MENAETATLFELQTFIKETCKQKGWSNRTALELMVLMTEEVGEVSKAIRHQTGFATGNPRDELENLGDELVDVLNYVLDIANHFNIDLAVAFSRKWEKNHKRTWE